MRYVGWSDLDQMKDGITNLAGAIDKCIMDSLMEILTIKVNQVQKLLQPPNVGINC